MSNWDKYDVAAKITSILSGIHYHKPRHHFGRPYLTAYQLAIAFDEKYHNVAIKLSPKLGGAGSGQHNSLAQYLSLELSRRIKNMTITNIEGAFISKNNKATMEFTTGRGDVIRNSLAKAYDLSMYRLK